MSRIPVCVALTLFSAIVSGCATIPRQPAIAQAAIEPRVLNPGDTAIVTVELDDRFDIVERVQGVVQEDTTITFNLTDDGAPPDAEAGDNVWTLQVDVPFQAPPGNFTMEVTGYNSDGEVVLVDGEEGETVPLSTTFEVVIEYPPAEAQ